MNRRDFVRNASLTTASAALAPAAFAQQPPRSPNDRIQLGIIGPGSRGKEDLRQLLHNPGVELVAACDVYEPRFAQVDAVAGHKVFHTKDYRELVARPDVDAFLIASPLACHRDHLLAALATGKPIYAEKAIGFTIDDNHAIYAAARQSKSLLQAGHQYRYASWILDAVARIRKGEIGEPTHMYGYWHRNNDWRRPVPSPDPGGKLEHLINWRLYRETSGGLVTELGVHQIDIANWVLQATPTHALGTTSIVRYHDGRTTGDNVQCIFLYPGGRRLVFSSLTDNAKQGNELWIYGTEGSVQITIEDATFFYEKPKAPPKPANATVIDHGVETGASYSTGNEMPYRGPGAKGAVPYEDATLAACRAFIQCVRSGTQPAVGVDIAFQAAMACSVAHDAVFTEEKTAIPGLPAA